MGIELVGYVQYRLLIALPHRFRSLAPFHSLKSSADADLRRFDWCNVNFSLVCVAAWTRFAKFLKSLGLSIFKDVWRCMSTWLSYAAKITVRLNWKKGQRISMDAV